MGTALILYEPPLPDGLYILSGKTPIPATDRRAWALWWHRVENRILAQTTVAGCVVSTVFLGIDHSFGVGSDPILFETMVLGDRRNDVCRRYRTWDEAMEGHKEIVGGMRWDRIRKIYSGTLFYGCMALVAVYFLSSLLAG